MEQENNVKEFANTKLKKKYFSSRLVSLLVKYSFIMAIVTFALSISMILLPIFMIVYFVAVLVLSFLLVIATLGLLLIALDHPDNPIRQMWDGFQHLEENVIPAMQATMKMAAPILGGIAIIACITMIVLVSKGMGKGNPHGDRAKLIVGIILAALGIVIAMSLR